MKSSTRLLVTHQRQFLPLCDRIVLMNEGKVETEGTWKDVESHPILKVVEQSREHEEVIHRYHSLRAFQNGGIAGKLRCGWESCEESKDKLKE